MYTNYTPSYYSMYLTFCVRYTISVNCMKFPIVFYSSCKSSLLVCLSTKLYNFKVQKSNQILCTHKPYFLMPVHNWCWSILKFETCLHKWPPHKIQFNTILNNNIHRSNKNVSYPNLRCLFSMHVCYGCKHQYSIDK